MQAYALYCMQLLAYAATNIMNDVMHKVQQYIEVFHAIWVRHAFTASPLKASV